MSPDGGTIHAPVSGSRVAEAGANETTRKWTGWAGARTRTSSICQPKKSLRAKWAASNTSSPKAVRTWNATQTRSPAKGVRSKTDAPQSVAPLKPIPLAAGFCGSYEPSASSALNCWTLAE